MVPYVTLDKNLLKNPLKTRTTLEINEIPNFNYDNAIFGAGENSPNSDGF